MSWPEPGWTSVQPFPFTAARSAFAGMTDDRDKVVLRYYKRGDGALVATAAFGPRAEGAPGLVHGGATLTALDEALGAAAWVAGMPCLTVRLETEFRRGLPVGAACLVTTHVERMRHGLADVAGELAGEDGTVYARALGRFKRLSPEAMKAMFGRTL
ncbi:MAG: PaaI family thioesterase [Elusimicrobiota bacterium]|nr:PaaI family thioesterase [Elusimicrobiota bacterium]